MMLKVIGDDRFFLALRRSAPPVPGGCCSNSVCRWAPSRRAACSVLINWSRASGVRSGICLTFSNSPRRASIGAGGVGGHLAAGLVDQVLHLGLGRLLHHPPLLAEGVGGGSVDGRTARRPRVGADQVQAVRRAGGRKIGGRRERNDGLTSGLATPPSRRFATAR